MRALLTEELFLINGGDADDYSFGHRCGEAAKTVYYAACDAWNWVCDKVSSWF